MRQIGTLLKEKEANRLAAFLVTQGIAAHAELDEDAWLIWVRDENHLDQAREILEQFRFDPNDRRYDGAERAAEAIQRKQLERTIEAQKNLVDVKNRWQQPTVRDAPLVMTMIILSVVVTMAGSFGQATKGTGGMVNRQLYFCTQVSFVRAEGNPLADVAKGELWRAITPIFIHLSLIHLVFNMIWFFQFGALVEKRRGTVRLALLVLSVAILSCIAQAIAPAQWGGTPMFGGMSGVVYGLFGYIWMKSLFDPGAGMLMPQINVIVLIGWLFLCMTGAVGPVANVAHAVGLVTGMVIGYLPTLIKK